MEKLKRGRKPIADKKKIISVYLRQSEIDKLGGMQEVRNIINEHLKNKQ
jgi:hypothetical protein